MKTAKYKRIFGIVMDSVGTGEAPDAAKFDDVGSDTLGHVGEAYQGKLAIPNLQKLGISNLRQTPIQGVDKVTSPIDYYGKMQETSAGKDSMDGHWEMMGLPVQKPLDTFPNGFPAEILQKIEAFSGRKVIGNRPESGTKIIAELGEQQMKTGDLIIYTSGDSVLQIAAHEDVIPLQELYKICEYARTLVNGPDYTIGRIIARPYVGPDKDHFTRTANRHDFTLEPTGTTDLDYLQKAGVHTVGIGKINDIFSGHGIDEGYHNESNMDGMDHVDHVMAEDFTGFCFTNLVDFDAMYGHRRNPIGFGEALMDFDKRLGTVLENLKDDDLLLITADHGNDPGFKGSDHTRELVPLLAYSPSMTTSGSLGVRQTFADFGATVLDNFGMTGNSVGSSFLTDLK
ncbi:Phosphopentomutase [Lentilactobacillus parabuchneri]|jgi:phosphopentomutase|uniref:Phosphopentomutase n=4 Tax=Lentilactobacillus parabuchneri TaxID=152331 RepID=A0A1X1FDQ1_9LACO|nr:phosphopentomutase [Lentilactobacillus parabuchneri]APR07917.1 Phosphopentomutase [Lentilactobacillus parabuchneri]KRM47158.1 phosphopentomutase [Lentilactobacillus parabuchneri DSM 5707 = NBRC 107865]KRN70919.1 phosphopentomutase [Lentilactobacillus parabuchneri]MBW0222111.1 phosphopentomutase [Lentilactobacillus parabuchneri]MBW0245652.1 phosphopentomutase [Lentilactobacillus parabuchneri]